MAPEINETENGIKKTESEDPEHDPHYDPIVSLPLVAISTNEESEVEMCKIRARLYRFDKVDHEWKERGTGDIKLLHHSDNGTVRVVMRRDKTLKLCANHFITDDMQLQPHIGSERAFNWTALGDYADETAKQEFLAVKFGNIENAKLWKTKFDEAQLIVKNKKTGDDTKVTTADDQLNSDETSSLSLNDSDASEQTELTKEADDAKILLQLSELSIEKEKNVTV